MGYPPYALPALGEVKRLGLFAPGVEGFNGLEHTLDLFHSHAVALVIQLGEAPLPRGTASSTDVDHLRRLLGRRRQAMLVCTDDLSRAVNLRRCGVWDTGARMVRPNLLHLDPGFTVRLSNDDIFVVVGPDRVASTHLDEKPTGMDPPPDKGRGLSGRVGLAVSANEPDFTRVVRLFTPKLLISGGSSAFLDTTYRLDDARTGPSSTRVIVFGDRAGQRIDHAIVDLSNGAVSLIPEPTSVAEVAAADHRRMEES